jgi:hypothetical protein
VAKIPESSVWYMPHGGLINQAGELQNAALLSRKRLPLPLLDRHASVLGISDPAAVWYHAVQLL